MPKLATLVGYILIGLTAVAHAEGGASSAYLPAVLSGILGFVGSLIGANFALRNFKRQRTFDKQLDWYERAAKAIYSLAERIEIACTFQAESGTSEEDLKKLWTDVQTAHLRIGRVRHESRFFATAEAIVHMDNIYDRVEEVAYLSETFDPPKIVEAKRKKALKEIFELIEWLTEACSPLIAEGVSHLGLDSRRSWWKRWTDKIAELVLPYWYRLTGLVDRTG
jgi:hypothetical protein